MLADIIKTVLPSGNTAMTELIEWAEKYHKDTSEEYLHYKDVVNAAQSLLPAEQQQIIDAYNEGYRDGETDDGTNKKDVSEFSNAENYFKQQFEIL